MADYLISAETRGQLIELLEAIIDTGSPGVPADPVPLVTMARDAVYILPHLEAAPEDRLRAIVERAGNATDWKTRIGALNDAIEVVGLAPESADPITAAKAEADRRVR